MAQLPGLGRHLLAVLELAAGDDHLGAALGERQDHLATEAAAAAGHQGDLAGEVEVRIRCHGHVSRGAACTVTHRAPPVPGAGTRVLRRQNSVPGLARTG